MLIDEDEDELDLYKYIIESAKFDVKSLDRLSRSHPEGYKMIKDLFTC